jgi:hypothetical protein
MNHKAMERRLRARAWYTAGRMMDWYCPRCGANSETMADKCSADLADPCPGFQRTEEVHKEFEQKHDALIT